MCVKNPTEWMNNHGLSKKESFLICSALYCMEKEVTLVQ